MPLPVPLLVNAANGLRLERFVLVPVIERRVGFAIIENILYIYDGSTPSGAWVLVVARLLTEFGSHVIFSSIVGAGLVYVMVSRGSKWVAVAAFVVALGLHLAWDVPRIWVDGVGYLSVTLLV